MRNSYKKSKDNSVSNKHYDINEPARDTYIYQSSKVLNHNNEMSTINIIISIHTSSLHDYLIANSKYVTCSMAKNNKYIPINQNKSSDTSGNNQSNRFLQNSKLEEINQTEIQFLQNNELLEQNANK